MISVVMIECGERVSMLCFKADWKGIRLYFFFQAEDGIRDLVRSRGLGDVYKRQGVADAA